jgi:hypothetical protein
MFALQICKSALQIRLVSPCDFCYISVVMYSPAPSEAVLDGERDQKAGLQRRSFPPAPAESAHNVNCAR